MKNEISIHFFWHIDDSHDILFVSGTTDRVCVITGFPDNVRNAHNIIWEHIREKCDKSNEEFKVGV